MSDDAVPWVIAIVVALFLVGFGSLLYSSDVRTKECRAATYAQCVTSGGSECASTAATVCGGGR